MWDHLQFEYIPLFNFLSLSINCAFFLFFRCKSELIRSTQKYAPGLTTIVLYYKKQHFIILNIVIKKLIAFFKKKKGNKNMKKKS